MISRPYTVVLGSDSFSGDEPTKQEFRSIQSFPHPDYDGHMNDIMLIKVLNSFNNKMSQLIIILLFIIYGEDIT